MSSFGAKNPYFVPIESEPEGAIPIYKGEPIKIGRLIKADLTLTMASGKLYADDELAESAEEFVSGSLVMETDDILDTVASVLYGASVKDKTVVYNIRDNPPPGGLAYYKKLMRHGYLFFQGFFYPRVKAALGNDTAQTKADSITFGTSSTTFTVFNANSGDWRFTEEFEKEADALAWVKSMLTSAAVEASSAARAAKSFAGEKVGV